MQLSDESAPNGLLSENTGDQILDMNSDVVRYYCYQYKIIAFYIGTLDFGLYGTNTPVPIRC